MERRVLSPQKVKFTRGSDQRLYFDAGQGLEGPVKARWAFPLSAPDAYVVLSGLDGKFIALLKNYKRLDAESLRLVEEALEEDYFLPRITKIESIDDKSQVMVWTVQTDRGPRRFEVKSRKSDIRWLSDHRLVVTDVDGNRYEIVDLASMDPASQEKLEMEV